ncbi:MAG: leucine-rich repeat domain-containing protein [Pseudomonadota bacterium]
MHLRCGKRNKVHEKMRILFGFLGVGVIMVLGWIGFHQVPIYKASLDAHAAAQSRIGALIDDETLTRLDLSDLDALRALPHEIGQVTQLEYLSLNNTNITDLRPLRGLENLTRLELGQTPVKDLTPLAELSSLRDLSLHRSWAFDLSPLSNLSNLEDLNLSYTAVQSLEPLVKLRNVEQLTLYSSYAHDGSKAHYDALEKSVFRLNNGNAYQQNYQPGFQYRIFTEYRRFVEKWTLGGPPTLKPSA